MEKAKHKEEKEKLLDDLNKELMSLENSDAMKSLTQDFTVKDVNDYYILQVFCVIYASFLMFDVIPFVCRSHMINMQCIWMIWRRIVVVVLLIEQRHLKKLPRKSVKSWRNLR